MARRVTHTFEVSIPTPDGGWFVLAAFPTKREAVQFIRDNVEENCDDEGKISLINDTASNDIKRE